MFKMFAFNREQRIMEEIESIKMVSWLCGWCGEGYDLKEQADECCEENKKQ